MKNVKPNYDKPHRCPKCHQIPDEARKDGRALPGKRYSCEDCKVSWVGPNEPKDHRTKLLHALVGAQEQGILEETLIELLDDGSTHHRLISSAIKQIQRKLQMEPIMKSCKECGAAAGDSCFSSCSTGAESLELIGRDDAEAESAISSEVYRATKLFEQLASLSTLSKHDGKVDKK